MDKDTQTAYEWAKKQDFPRIEARYAKMLATEVDRLTAELHKAETNGEAAFAIMCGVAEECERLKAENARLTAELATLKEAQRWIPVTERLPGPYIPVLVNRGHSYCDSDGYEGIRITARTSVTNCLGADWMPHPAPPEKEEGK